MYTVIIIAISVNWFQMTGLPAKLKWLVNNRSVRPLDCPLCLGFWICIPFAIKFNCFELPILASFTAAILERLINKL